LSVISYGYQLPVISCQLSVEVVGLPAGGRLILEGCLLIKKAPLFR